MKDTLQKIKAANKTAVTGCINKNLIDPAEALMRAILNVIKNTPITWTNYGKG